MLNNSFKRTNKQGFPNLLYQLSLDFFSIINFWQPTSKGIDRGRDFEKIFKEYCEINKFRLSESSGSRTLDGIKSASGFKHENDAVLTTPDFIIYFELKSLTEELKKNELLIFNQKGIDFFISEKYRLKKIPLYRIIISNYILTQEARCFCLYWGIIIIEPDRLPLILIELMTQYDIAINAGINDHQINEIFSNATAVNKPLQEVIKHIYQITYDDKLQYSFENINKIINTVQRVWGDRMWQYLDEVDGQWLEGIYDKLNIKLKLDNY